MYIKGGYMWKIISAVIGAIILVGSASNSNTTRRSSRRGGCSRCGGR